MMEPRRLAEAQELIVDEAVLHAVELVDIVDDGQALILHKILNKRVSAEGNTEPLIPLRSEALNMEQVGGKVREGRVCTVTWFCQARHCQSSRSDIGRAKLALGKSRKKGRISKFDSQ